MHQDVQVDGRKKRVSHGETRDGGPEPGWGSELGKEEGPRGGHSWCVRHGLANEDRGLGVGWHVHALVARGESGGVLGQGWRPEGDVPGSQVELQVLLSHPKKSGRWCGPFIHCSNPALSSPGLSISAQSSESTHSHHKH